MTACLAPPIDRRRLLLGGALAFGAPWLHGCAGPARAPDTPPASAELALIDRVTWGADSSAIALWNRGSRRDFLDRQLHPSPKTPLPAGAQARLDALAARRMPLMPLVQDMTEKRRAAEALADDEAKKAAQQAWQREMNGHARDAASAFLLRALYSPDQLQEQLAWFWFNHFNVHQYKANLRLMVGDYQDTLRTRALGRFRDLLIASATHPAMIRYLDNEQNAANRINENYAREVMELHTLGVDGGYSQKDVQELARVLTGLGLNFSDRTPALRPDRQALYVRQGAVEFNPARHDMGEKRVLGVQVDGRGWPEIIDELDRLARHPSTARHVSRQLAVFFAADEPPPALVGRMAAAFEHSDGDIARTLQVMFEAPEFTPTLGRKFKDPVHYVISAVRLAHDGRTVLDCAPMLAWLNRLGEGLYNRQTPDGYPLTAAAWVGSGQMSTRFEIARAIGGGGAGLFRIDGQGADTTGAAQMAKVAYTLGAPTERALADASTLQERNALLLSSPEFMFR